MRVVTEFCLILSEAKTKIMCLQRALSRYHRYVFESYDRPRADLRLEVPEFKVETTAILLHGSPWRRTVSSGAPLMHAKAALPDDGNETAPAHDLFYRGTLERAG